MVKFDELRISEDGRFLTVECHVENYDMYREMYIESIYLEYYKNRGATGMSEKALLLFENHNDVPTDVRGVRKCISVNDLPSWFECPAFRGGLFYVYVTCNGSPTGEHAIEMDACGCSFSHNHDTGIIVDWKALYEKIMPLVAQYASKCSGCEVPADFETMILLWNAFRFAVDVCDYEQLEKIWDELMGIESSGRISSGCGCR